MRTSSSGDFQQLPVPDRSRGPWNEVYFSNEVTGPALRATALNLSRCCSLTRSARTCPRISWCVDQGTWSRCCWRCAGLVGWTPGQGPWGAQPRAAHTHHQIPASPRVYVIVGVRCCGEFPPKICSVVLSKQISKMQALPQDIEFSEIRKVR